jgi:mannan polymerase II complex MNN10 subunit
MSLDRSPSPRRGGGWSSPGLTSPYDSSSPRSRSPAKKYGELNGGAGVTWASAKANSARVNGYPSYVQSQNQGFFGRHYRKLSQSLPYFTHGGQEDRFAEKEKLGRGRAGGGSGWGRWSWREVPRRVGLLLSRRRKYFALLLVLVLGVLAWFRERTSHISIPLHRHMS